DAGADLVLGHGPHVPRAIELYRGRLIAYSLGNFATWWGISIAGPRGQAPLLALRLNGRGEFLGGRIHSFRQRRPDGPRPDPEERAAAMIRALTLSELPDTGLTFTGPAAFEPRQPPAGCGAPRR
ncbi:MAG: CapA family protein, partial [Gammaproteobacteria bacterium]